MSVEKLYDELEQIRTSNIRLRAEIDQSQERIRQCLKERDKLNAEVKSLSEEIKERKANRDSINAKVKELKEKRDGLRKLASEKQAVFFELLEKAREFSKRLPGSMPDVLKRIEELDWHIQTNPLTPEAERELVGKVSALEKLLLKHKDLKAVREKLGKLKTEIGAFRTESQSVHKNLLKLAEESESVHNRIRECYNLLVARKKEADQQHSEYIKASEERRKAIDALAHNSTRIDEIRKRIAETVHSDKVEKAERVKSKYKEAAAIKLRDGKKLSLEEFQALMADRVSDSED